MSKKWALLKRLMHRVVISAIAAAAFLGFSFSAKANLGETPEEVAKRYGPGTAPTPDEIFNLREGSESHKYSANGLEVVVLFIKGKSVAERFTHKGKEVTEEDLKELRKIYGVGHSWHLRIKCWVRGDKKVSVSAWRNDTYGVQFENY